MTITAYDFFLMTLQTLGMTLISTLIAYIIGLPLGVLLYSTSKNGIKPNKIINLFVGIIVNIIRSVPCLILVVVCLPFTRSIFGTGIGEWYTILPPLIICSFGFVARMVEQSLAEIDPGKIEAVRSLGATNWQLIIKVLLPEARSSLVSGLAVSIVSILGYTSFADTISAGGLINRIVRYYSNHPTSYMQSWEFWVMIVLVVVLVILFQELGLFISKKLDKRRFSK